MNDPDVGFKLQVYGGGFGGVRFVAEFIAI